jgi:ABC-type branched-subunit amino acid transport system substrate-binding protein
MSLVSGKGRALGGSRHFRLTILAAAAVLSSCTLIVDGIVNQCTTDSDCSKLGSGLQCVNRGCVRANLAGADPDCAETAGVDAPGSRRFAAVLGFTTSSGSADPRGPVRAMAIKLAIDGLNDPANRLTTDPTYFVRLCDDHDSTTEDVAKATELVSDGYLALITGGTSSTLAVSDVAAPLGVPTISVSASSSQLVTAGLQPDGGPKLVWSVGISDAVQAQVLGQVAADAGYRSAAAVVNSADGFEELYQLIDQATLAQSSGNLFVSSVSFSDGPDAGLAQAVGQVLAGASPPDVVFPVMAISDSTPFFNAWFAATPRNPAWLFTDNSYDNALFEDTLSDGGVDNARLAFLLGSLGTGPALPSTSPVYLAFYSLFEQTYNQDPNQVSYVPNAYDAALLLAAASVWGQFHGGATPESVAAGLGHLSALGQPIVSLEPGNFPSTIEPALSEGLDVNVTGASGTLDFDPLTGIASSPVQLWTLTDAGFVTLQVYESVDGGLARQ